MYNKLAAKVNNIDTSALVLKTEYQTDKTELENKIPDVNDFVKKETLTELEKKKSRCQQFSNKNCINCG